LPSQVQIRNERLRQLCDWGLKENVLGASDPAAALAALFERAEAVWPFLTPETMRSYAQAALRMLRLRAPREAARVQASGTPPG